MNVQFLAIDGPLLLTPAVAERARFAPPLAGKLPATALIAMPPKSIVATAVPFTDVGMR